MVYVLLADGFEEIEAIVPVDLLRRAGIEVCTVSLVEGPVVGGQGMVFRADITLEQVRVDEMKMVLLPGGLKGVERLRENNFVGALLQQAYDCGVYIAAICAAPTILAQLGMLDRRKGVCYPGMEEDMGSAIVDTTATVVQDGRIITAQAAGSSFEFALALITVLRDDEVAERVRASVHYKD